PRRGRGAGDGGRSGQGVPGADEGHREEPGDDAVADAGELRRGDPRGRVLPDHGVFARSEGEGTGEEVIPARRASEGRSLDIRRACTRVEDPSALAGAHMFISRRNCAHFTAVVAFAFA